MTYYHRATVVVTIAAILTLSACQPSSQEVAPLEEPDPHSQVITETSPQQPIREDNAAIVTDTDSSSVIIDTEALTKETKDYIRAMDRMRDEMLIGMGYNDPDAAFAKVMLGHRRGAIELAKVELKYGTDSEMRKFAQEIINSQQTKMDTLNKWLANNLDTLNPKPNTQTMQQEYNSRMDVMYEAMQLGASDPIADKAFARVILAHHLGAEAMAGTELKHGTDQQMLELAREVLKTQKPRIKWLQQWIANTQPNISNIESENNIGGEISDNETEEDTAAIAATT